MYLLMLGQWRLTFFCMAKDLKVWPPLNVMRITLSSIATHVACSCTWLPKWSVFKTDIQCWKPQNSLQLNVNKISDGFIQPLWSDLLHREQSGSVNIKFLWIWKSFFSLENRLLKLFTSFQQSLIPHSVVCLISDWHILWKSNSNLYPYHAEITTLM